ncbi:NUDIX hydrolase [Phyllobacterium phragmitis]|uniref:NUDIX hydrolase n=1 Tax=Phyllobacterium phragmitis TaxID=2670329 RepID=A0A2S9IX85_9HYPH|nr:NUDIX hydrolase [Phyllobacterium phragmitis]PRD45135.1 NUDIX hydrolase [Phyllobacterium phragmitis]
MDGIPENTVIPIDRVEVRVVPGALDYAIANKAAIERNWRDELAANPNLFNGEFYFAPQASIGDGVLRADFVRTLYETLLYWRRDPQEIRPWHIFGVGVVVSADNHLIAARMAARNAGGGRIYFPAGSIDDNDIADGMVDYDSNSRREVHEETGLDLSHARQETKIHLVTGNRSIALFRRYRFAEDAATLIGRIEDHLAGQDDPELDQIIKVTGPGQMGEATPSYVKAFADWHFNDAG